MDEEREGFLSPYRVLDLTDEKGLLCAKILADLGADVIKIEPPGGCPSRKIGPFYKDIPHPEKSLFWFAYNANKRGITLNVECEDGREIFKKLVTTADIVIESFPPGYLKTRGLGYDDLCRIRPDIILTSITPFGQDGPYKDFQASDLVCWSMGGFAYLTGDSDRPPVQVSFPQAYLAGANEATTATMVALYYREISGKGQHVDVSIQASVAKDMMNAPLFWEAAGVNLRRAGPFRIGLNIASGQKVIWKCKDGEVSFFFWGGKGGARTNRALVEYMEEDGIAPAFMKEMEWETFDMATAPEELFNEFSHHMEKFFQAHTKKELFQKSVKKKMTLYPVQNTADITADTQLQERNFWAGIEHSELEERLPYPNPPFLLSEELRVQKRRAPLIGEHNEEVYRGELGIPREEMIKLKELGVL
jgi:crotonobetainyl-CoA:carnitine CoA-transferase CaiB-like acyl-CoA transferase